MSGRDEMTLQAFLILLAIAVLGWGIHIEARQVRDEIRRCQLAHERTNQALERLDATMRGSR